ncbi:MAG: MBL fold metallo-hydrolase [Anaerolineales bacterium]
MLEMRKWVLGPVATNTYLVGDPEAKQAVVIDPAWDGARIAGEIQESGWVLHAVWLTHAHFDHFAGLGELVETLGPELPEDFYIGMHPKELPLWKVKGGAIMFGIPIKKQPRPGHDFQEGDGLFVGDTSFIVHHAPGHSAGHVMFHCPEEKILFSGDVIFNRGIGRTDLLGGSYQTLLDSIRRWVLSLPDETRIYPGHGPETTVGDERENNPFL